jgi:hypothetical protein
MAGYQGVAAVGRSLERLLTAKFAEDPGLADALSVAAPPVAVVARTEDFDSTVAGSVIAPPTLSLFLYRVDFSKTMRAAWSGVGHRSGKSQLPLDLHFLITPWASNAVHEHLLLGRAMQILETLPIISGALLHPSGDWAPGESIQIVMEELSTEAVMRTFDSLPVDYRLSVPYIARVVRIEGREELATPDVSTAVTGLSPLA